MTKLVLTEDKHETTKIKVKIGKVKDLMDHGYDSPVQIAALINEPVSDVKRWMELINMVKSKDQNDEEL